VGRRILYIAQSLDGFIADAEGGVSWLDPYQSGDEDYGYAEFLAGVEAILMGSRTYLQVLDFGSWPYPGTPAWVVTHRELPVPAAADVRFAAGPMTDVLRDVQEDTPGDCWIVGGAEVVGQLIAEDLLDAIVLFVAPVLLGSGVRLFPANRDLALELTGARTYQSGLVELRYRRAC